MTVAKSDRKKMLNYGLVIAFVLIYCGHEITPKTVIKKCCQRDEFMSMGRCLKNKNDKNNNTRYVEDWHWVPAEFRDALRNISADATDVTYGEKLPCIDTKSHDLLNFSENEFHLHVVDREMRLEVSKETSLHDIDVRPSHSVRFPSSEYCIDAMPTSSRSVMFVVMLCPCVVATCVRKCCHDSYAFNVSSGSCEESPDEVMDWMPTVPKRLVQTLEYYRLVGMPECSSPDHRHITRVVKNNKTLNLREDLAIQALDNNDVYATDTYCGDYNMQNDELLIVCEAKPTSYSVLYGVCFVIGACALFLAVLVSLLLPEQLRKLHGRLALAHNCMLLVGYVIAGVMHFVDPGTNVSTNTCKGLSFVTQFSILAAFFWLNVMCIDISWVFSGLRPPRGNATQREWKKFVYYSLYAWGSTIVITVCTLIVEYSPSTRDSPVRPRFGENGCYFNNRGAMLLFFYGPMSILLILNLLLFVYTAYKIISLKRQTAILTSAESSVNNKNKQRLALYVKLFCLMGVTWIFEVLSWAVGGPKSMWLFTDVINLLRGVFIFVIFCCKKKVYRQLRDRLLRMCGRHVAMDATSSSRDTRSYHTSSSVGTKSVVSTPGGTPVANRRHMLQKQHTQVSKLSLELNNL